MDELSFGEKRCMEATRSRLQQNEKVVGKMVVLTCLHPSVDLIDAIATILQVLEYHYLVRIESTGQRLYVVPDMLTTQFCVVIHGLQNHVQYNYMVGRVMSACECGRMEVKVDITNEIHHIRLVHLSVHLKSVDVIVVNELSVLTQCLRPHDEVVFFETDVIWQQPPAHKSFRVVWPGGPRVILEQVIAFFGRID